ncbi:MAG TPA: BspA family leucine-rich repeat surface protein, partial [Nitrospinaceae bacterium]|nr:BspA family leucine-rich repeat surface protein [Nitrospinaceae bacterium]
MRNKTPAEDCLAAKGTLFRRVFIITALLFLCVGGSAYAACIVAGTSYDTISTPLTPSSKITAANIKGGSYRSRDDITTCDVTGITDMSSLFDGTSYFNQDISAWDVSNVTDMSLMFSYPYADYMIFNQDISSWDVSSVTNFSQMFVKAKLFDQNIRSWDVSSATNFYTMFLYGSAMHTTYTGVTGFASTPTSSFFGQESTAPTISSTTVASDNSTIAVTFSEAVYNATGGSGALETSDFTLSISGG